MQGNIAQVKVVLLGESGVGKSSIMLRFIANSFKNDSAPTVGASYMSKVIQFSDRTVKFNIWDTAGQERYHSLAKMYLHDANAAILLYDITNKKTFDSLRRWYEELKEVAQKNIIIAVCGNKEDLITNEVVNPEDAREYAKSIEGFYKKISAKTSQGVEGTFKEIASKIFSDISAEPSVKNSITLERKNSKTSKKKKCC